MPEVVDFIERYARAIAAPVETGTTVTSVRARPTTAIASRPTRATGTAATLVVASGRLQRRRASRRSPRPCPPRSRSLTPHEYRNPDQLPTGGVLVVGASATGIQIADEIHRSGRPVTLAVGEHVRVPRIYRGRDIHWWMDRAGVLDERYDEVDDIVRARALPSLQLAGSPERATLDLNALLGIGVELVGPPRRHRRRHGCSSPARCTTFARSPTSSWHRLLDTIDDGRADQGIDDAVAGADRFAPTAVPEHAALEPGSRARRDPTIVWATGFRPDYSWLDVPVLDRKGMVRHDGGVVGMRPGMYLMGMPFLRRRKSTLIDGAGDDARELAEHLALHLGGRPRQAPGSRYPWHSAA